jgi:hypothetical protein
MTCCDKGKPIFAKGKCQACYARERRARPEVKAKALEATAKWAQQNKTKLAEYARERRKLPNVMGKLKAKARRNYKQNRLKRFGLTPETFDEMWLWQGGACQACRRPMRPTGVANDSCTVDHCHQTGRVRGLLCCGCNKALGLLRDDALVVEALAFYARNA